jgi:hypothetical protein
MDKLANIKALNQTAISLLCIAAGELGLKTL